MWGGWNSEGVCGWSAVTVWVGGVQLRRVWGWRGFAYYSKGTCEGTCEV